MGIEWILFAAATVFQAQEGPQEPDPRDFGGDRSNVAPPLPKPEYPAADGFTLRAHLLRSRFSLETREFDVGAFSGPMNLGDVASLGRNAVGLEGVLDTGPFRFSVFGLHQDSKAALSSATQFEQHSFTAGTEARTTAFYGSAEAYWRFDVAGDAAATFRLSLLLGLDASKFAITMSDGGRTASEGFSALWPVPAAGLEARFQLSDRVAVCGELRGTRIKYVNPFQIDGGEAQDVFYSATRALAGLKWDPTRGISLSAGYTALQALVEISSPEDTDTGGLAASGFHASLTVRF